VSDSPSPTDENAPTAELAASEAESSTLATTRQLIDRMLASEWPAPELLEAILARGAKAVDPLREVLRRDPDELPDWPFVLALNLLGSLGDPSALAELLPLFRSGHEAVLDWLDDAVGRFGAPVIEPLLEIARDPSLEWYPRARAIETAKLAAGADPALQARIGEVVRTLLSGYLERARAGETLVEDEEELVSMMVCDLADLVDPQSLDLIRAAFAADIVETFMVDLKSVEASYRKGEARVRDVKPHAWLNNYKGQLQSHLDQQRRASEPPRATSAVSRPPSTNRSAPMPEPARRLEPIESIRKTDPRPGRNDPCWCGSGKKYKKCHMLEDQA
jgi:SEC-C motif